MALVCHSNGNGLKNGNNGRKRALGMEVGFRVLENVFHIMMLRTRCR